MLPMIVNDVEATIICSNEVINVSNEHPYFVAIIKAAQAGNEKEVMDFYSQSSIPAIIATKSQDKLVVVGDEVYYDDVKLHGTIVKRVIELVKRDLSLDSIIKFLNNLNDNPSLNSVEELYNFLDHKNMPIDSDGNFYGYKAVKVYHGKEFTDKLGRLVKDGDYVDKYSGTIRNNVGDVVTVPRNTVDDNKNMHCSKGLHIGCSEYSAPGGWYYQEGDVVLLVKCNPKNAVSVPTDHNFTKIRVCEYEVVSVYKSLLNKTVYEDSDDLEWDDDWEDESEVPHYLEANDLRFGEEISFEYDGKIRFGTIDAIDSVSIRLILSPCDPSYKNKIEYRNFLKSKMSSIELE